LGDVAAGAYGVQTDATGLVLVLLSFDRFAATQRDSAQALLDIFAGQARNAALIGHRMMRLLQSNDARLSFEPVGATPVMWNDAEWLDAKRGQSTS
jgi:hypothetical protein